MKQILFVCSGNTCRSPMAEGIARKLIAERGPEGVEVSSAGTSAVDGAGASGNAVVVARANGIDVGGHRSRLLNATMVRGASLIVTMGEKHRRTVGVIDPAALAYTVNLTGFCDRFDGDVADPFGGDVETYRMTFDMIRECVEGLLSRLADGGFDAWRRDET